MYDVRLDLITRSNALKPLPRCVGDDALEAVRRAFAQAERELIAWQGERGTAKPGAPLRDVRAMR